MRCVTPMLRRIAYDTGSTTDLIYGQMSNLWTTIPRNHHRWPALLSRLLPAASLVFAVAAANIAVADGLRVDSAENVAFAVAEMTATAEDMGLSKADLTITVTDRLGRAGLRARLTDAARDEDLLLVDVVVEEETFYVSLGFWRMASYPQPGGESSSGFVTVWQDYSVGAHHGDVDTVYTTVTAIIDRFITRYSDANELGDSVQVAAAP